jgi:selenocysteine-specific elongation factor
MFVLGTAGHIDHGKSLLVKALTGIDPDRLREEKERGMTIDLGFAWLKLPSGREVGIVDVPGHERFVKNMLAGVGGIDLALLIIAANESIMPQTREHLAIINILGIKRGIIVITKKDLVDADILGLVKIEAEELVKPTTLSAAPVMAVSALTGEGMPELIAAIDKMLETAEPKTDLGRPRLPIDRIFTMSGAGTVVTGTLIDGSLKVGQEVEIAPSGLKTRIRGLQTHKAKIETASPGSRVAANLVGVSIEQLERGDVVTSPGWLEPVQTLTVKLTLISYLKHPLRHGVEVSLHTLAAETMAKIRLLEAEELKPGGVTWAQIILESPIAAIKGDRYIIRSPMETLGGGMIIDVRSKRLRRFKLDIIESLKARESGTSGDALLTILESQQPLDFNALAVRSNLVPDVAVEMIESLIGERKIVALGEGEKRLLFNSTGWARLGEKATASLTEYHQKYPARSGMPKAELSSRLKLGFHVNTAFANFIAQGTVVEEGGYLRLPSHKVKLTPSQQAKIDTFLKSLVASPYAPPGENIPEADLVTLLIEQGKVVKVSDTVVFTASAYREMVEKMKSRIKEKGKVGLGEVRDMFGTSRKYAQALLEYTDREKITRRVGDDRILF